jgi:hypothetical protein
VKCTPTPFILSEAKWCFLFIFTLFFPIPLQPTCHSIFLVLLLLVLGCTCLSRHPALILSIRIVHYYFLFIFILASGHAGCISRNDSMFIIFSCIPIPFAICTSTFSKLCETCRMACTRVLSSALL